MLSFFSNFPLLVPDEICFLSFDVSLLFNEEIFSFENFAYLFDEFLSVSNMPSVIICSFYLFMSNHQGHGHTVSEVLLSPKGSRGSADQQFMANHLVSQIAWQNYH